MANPPKVKRKGQWTGQTISWEEEVKAIIKAELKRQRMTYANLAKRFGDLGIPVTEPTLRNKISRGTFSAAFFLQCLVLIGSPTLHLSELSSILPSHKS
jgi:hypothetical protein